MTTYAAETQLRAGLGVDRYSVTAIDSWHVNGRRVDHQSFVAGVTLHLLRTLAPHTFCPVDGCTLLETDRMCPACWVRRAAL